MKLIIFVVFALIAAAFADIVPIRVAEQQPNRGSSLGGNLGGAATGVVSTLGGAAVGMYIYAWS